MKKLIGLHGLCKKYFSAYPSQETRLFVLLVLYITVNLSNLNFTKLCAGSNYVSLLQTWQM